MKPNGNGNGHQNVQDTVVIDPAIAAEKDMRFVFLNNPAVAPPQAVQKASKKKRGLILLLILALFAFLGLLFFLLIRQTPKERVDVKATERVGDQNRPQKIGQPSPDQQTQAAIDNLNKSIPHVTGKKNSVTDLTTDDQIKTADKSPAADSLLRGETTVSPATDAAATALMEKTRTANGSSTQAVHEEAAKSTASETPVTVSRPNTIKTIILDDTAFTPTPVRSAAPAMGVTSSRIERPGSVGSSRAEIGLSGPVILPDFAAMLPVITRGTILTIRANSYVRMETTYQVERDGWNIAKGTKIIGKVTGSGGKRAFVDVIGFIDPETRKLVAVNGTVIGPDGGDGLKGERRKLDPERGRILRRMAANGINILGTIAAGFGRSSNAYVFDSAGGGRVINPVAAEIGNTIEQTGRSNSASYVEVKAATPAFVMITSLPKEIKGIGAEEAEQLASTTEMSEQELSELLLLGSREEIEQALPRMREEQKALASRIMAEQKNKRQQQQKQ